jgi:hypothetical protein
MTQAPIEVDRGEVAFFGPMAFAPIAVNDVEGLWIRGRLAEVPQDPGETEIDTVRTRIEVSGEGVLPEKAFANLDNGAFIPLDLGKNTFPFGKEPKPDCVLYLACDELVQTPEAYISVDLQLADQGAFPRPGAERSAGAGVGVLGRQALALPRPLEPARHPARGRRRVRLPRRHARDLAVRARSASAGPRTWSSVEVNGESKRWIRCRIEKGDYGQCAGVRARG